MKYALTWAGLLALISGLWVVQRLKRLPGVETRATRWTIEGPFTPGEMPADLQAQWDDLKRTGIGPNHPDF